MIKEDLCAHRLSKRKTNFLEGYLFFIKFTSSPKYYSKVSFFVPPP
jgi:hypothetical protein